ncbi:hypothetical protein AXK60_03930 [Tsukamurella pseudospumae]|uniref:Uncharacterized protein n=2 Tax=Tsukamurella pseudospumae TaxID=239498 RepID=A0A138AX70_9ACTN|nr:hypothetical protein AXK61_00320 [Tsukamurella pseudospumae]KXP15020.1 hypothetical protein AXK60_03930 [Tsukamurella pseudospumae]
MAFAVVLGFAVLLMHQGVIPMGHTAMAAMSHGSPDAPADVAAVAGPSVHHQTVEKPSVDAVHDHHAHDCAGTVVVHKSVGAPSLVAVLPLSDGTPDTGPADRAAVARGPPPWTVLDLSQLCLLRV